MRVSIRQFGAKMSITDLILVRSVGVDSQVAKGRIRIGLWCLWFSVRISLGIGIGRNRLRLKWLRLRLRLRLRLGVMLRVMLRVMLKLMLKLRFRHGRWRMGTFMRTCIL